MTHILYRTSIIAGITFASLAIHAQTSSPSVKKPTVQSPRVATPTAPTATNPAAGGQRVLANMVAPAFNEIAFKSAADADAVVFLVFSQAGDSIWEAQAPLLKTILKESEFGKIANFEIDLKNAALATRFSVTAPGTILVMKGGVERIRSQRMITADVIRKMLRLHTVL